MSWDLLLYILAAFGMATIMCVVTALTWDFVTRHVSKVFRDMNQRLDSLDQKLNMTRSERDDLSCELATCKHNYCALHERVESLERDNACLSGRIREMEQEAKAVSESEEASR